LPLFQKKEKLLTQVELSDTQDFAGGVYPGFISARTDGSLFPPFFLESLNLGAINYKNR
jgi:hypothetical protein